MGIKLRFVFPIQPWFLRGAGISAGCIAAVFAFNPTFGFFSSQNSFRVIYYE